LSLLHTTQSILKRNDLIMQVLIMQRLLNRVLDSVCKCTHTSYCFIFFIIIIARYASKQCVKNVAYVSKRTQKAKSQLGQRCTAAISPVTLIKAEIYGGAVENKTFNSKTNAITLIRVCRVGKKKNFVTRGEVAIRHPRVSF